jgi:two-component system, NarL family, response regulator DesR
VIESLRPAPTPRRPQLRSQERSGPQVRRLLVVDEHPIVAVALRKILEDEADLVVDVLTDVAAAERAIAVGTADVVVAEIGFSGTSHGLDLLPALRPNRPPVIVLTGLAYPGLIRSALERGAASVVPKTAPIDQIAAAIRAVADGERVVPPAILAVAQRARRLPAPRELAVIRQVVRGSTNEQIADQLGIRRPTVEAVLRRLFDRYALSNRTALARVATEEGWLLEVAG